VTSAKAIPVVLLHAADEAAEARNLAESIREFGYEVWHTGEVLVGNVVVKELSERLALGGPVVICGTARAAGSKWLRIVVAHVQAMNTPGRTRIFPVRMDSDADLEALGLGAKIAECSPDPRTGLEALRKALAYHFPSGDPTDESLLTHGDLPAGDFNSWLTQVVGYSDGAVRSFREKLRPDIRESKLPDTLDADDFLLKANLAAHRRLYSAAVLLFTATPETTIGSAYVQCVHYSGFDRATGQDGRECVGPLVTQLTEAMTFIENRIRKTEIIAPGAVAAQSEFQFPMVCIREVLANALCHRDYLDSKRHTHVRLFQNKIEIVSPGRWAARSIPERLELQLADLMSEPVSRNERLAKALRWVRLVETQGSGIPNALSDCLERGAPPPVVIFADEMVKVTIFPRRDWDTTIFARRSPQPDVGRQGQSLTANPHVIPPVPFVQCDTCYCDVELGDHCSICGSLLSPRAGLSELTTDKGDSTVLSLRRAERNDNQQSDPDNESRLAAQYVTTIVPNAIHHGRAFSKHDYAERVRIENHGMVNVEIVGIESDKPWIIVASPVMPFTLPCAKSAAGGASSPTAAVRIFEFKVTCNPAELSEGGHDGTVIVRLRGQEPISVGVTLDVIVPRPYHDYVGIDFGTTNSVVAVMNKNRREIELVKDETSGEYLIPSVLVFDDAETYKIGQVAKNEADSAPDRTVRSIKRVMGYESDRRFFNRPFSAADLASLIIRKLLELAEGKLYRDTGTYYDIRNAIITVPANFYDVQIRDVLEACVAAGLDIESDQAKRVAKIVEGTLGEAINAGIILDEPSAAVLYYIDHLRHTRSVSEIAKLIDREQGLRLLVFDYGGGTLDVSVASVTRLKDGGTGLRILANMGENTIGGDTIDLVVMNELLRRCKHELQNFEFDTTLISSSFKELEERCDREGWSTETWREILRVRGEWKDLGETAKIRLAESEHVDIEIQPQLIVRLSGGALQRAPRATQHQSLTHEQLWNLLQPILTKCASLIDTSLSLSQTSRDDIDYILHTGRQSLLPQIRERVRELFPNLANDRDLLEEEHLKVCVAKGAALYGSMRNRLVKAEARLYFLSEGRRLPHSYGVETYVDTLEPEFDEIISRGDIYPVEKTKRYPPDMIPPGGYLNLRFYQNTGTSKAIKSNPKVSLIGQISIDTTADGEPGCNISFVIGANRTLEVFADGAPVFIERAGLQDEEAWWR